MNFNLSELIIISPILCLFIFGLIPVVYNGLREKDPLSPFASLFISLFAVIFAIGLELTFVKGYWQLSGVNYIEVFSKCLMLDGIAVWTSYIIYIVLGFSLFLAFETRDLQENSFARTVFLIFCTVIGSVLTVMANHLITVVISFELLTFSVLGLLFVGCSNEEDHEVGIKLMIQNLFVSAVMVFGIGFIYGAAGSFSFHDIGALASKLFDSNILFRFGVVLFLLSLFFKTGLFPLHAWSIETYRRTPTALMAIMSIASLTSSFVVLIRFFMYADFYNISSDQLIWIVQILSVLTILFASLRAVVQRDLKMILIYGLMSHVGYALMSFVVSSFGVNPQGGISSLIFYLFSLAIMLVGSLAFVLIFERNRESAILIDDLKGLVRSHPTLATLGMLIFTSFAGLPPTIGFFAKTYVFAAAIEQGYLWLALVGLMGSILGVYTYLRPVMYMFMEEGERALPRLDAFYSHAIVALSGFGILVFGLFASKLFYFIQSSVVNSL